MKAAVALAPAGAAAGFAGNAFAAAAQTTTTQTAGAASGAAFSILPWVIAAAAVAIAVAAWVACRRQLARMSAAQQAAEAARARALAALDASPAGLLCWIGDDAAPEIRGNLHAILGIAPGSGGRDDGETLGPARLSALAMPQDRPALDTAFQVLRNTGTAFDLRFRLAADGRTLRALGRRAGTRPSADVVVLAEDSTMAAALAGASSARDRLQALIDSLPMPVWARDPDLGLAFCNTAYARAADATRAEAVARNAEIAGAARALAQRARDLRVAQSESQHVVVDGNRRLFDFVEEPRGDGSLVGHALDMTSLEDTQSELARHIAAHAEVLENLNTGIVIYGPDVRVKFFNNAFVDLFNLDPDFLGTEPTMAEVLEAMRERRRTEEVPNFPAYKRERVKQLMGLIAPLEELLHLPNDSTLRSLAAPHPFGGVLITYENVTDRLALERSYNTLIEVQRETLDNLYEGIAVYGSDGRLKLSNPAFARMWGLQPEDLAGEPHVSAIVERSRPYFDQTEDWDRLKNRIVELAADRETRHGRIERPDGSVLDFVSVPLPDGGCLFTYIDVTDSTRVERALRERNAALETADRLKSEFIANVSYELRTPLNAIIGFAEILNLQYFGTLNERQVEYSRGIVEASQRLLSLINDILDIATIEAGHMQLDLAPVDLRALFGALQVLTGERARNCELGLELSCAPNVGLVVGDERRLKQAIYNLISNAIKFTPPGGRITVTATRNGDEVALQVVDTGIGISPEDQPRVFEKFAQTSGAQRHGGAGVGMALVKSLIELHGGRVSLDSTPGQGTTVTCRIPVKGPVSPLSTSHQAPAAD
jgi:signal transduction histidine kinase